MADHLLEGGFDLCRPRHGPAGQRPPIRTLRHLAMSRSIEADPEAIPNLLPDIVVHVFARRTEGEESPESIHLHGPPHGSWEVVPGGGFPDLTRFDAEDGEVVADGGVGALGIGEDVWRAKRGKKEEEGRGRKRKEEEGKRRKKKEEEGRRRKKRSIQEGTVNERGCVCLGVNKLMPIIPLLHRRSSYNSSPICQ